MPSARIGVKAVPSTRAWFAKWFSPSSGKQKKSKTYSPVQGMIIECVSVAMGWQSLDAAQARVLQSLQSLSGNISQQKKWLFGWFFFFN
jgi:hypothetical protein